VVETVDVVEAGTGFVVEAGTGFVVEAGTGFVVDDVAEVDVVVGELDLEPVCVLSGHLGEINQPEHVLDPVAGHTAHHLG